MKKLFLPYLFLVLFIGCSADNSVTPVNPHQQQLAEFNNSSGFNAGMVDDTGLVGTAKRFQGQGDYPGVDDWFAVDIKFSNVVLGGLPGQSAFYSILQTYYTSNGNKEAYWKLLQVKPHPVFGYRKLLGCFQINRK